jgi:hypothetical protein
MGKRSFLRKQMGLPSGGPFGFFVHLAAKGERELSHS